MFFFFPSSPLFFFFFLWGLLVLDVVSTYFTYLLLFTSIIFRYGGAYGGAAAETSYGGSSYGYGAGGGGMSGDRMLNLGSGLRKPEWTTMTLPPFEKNFYREHPNVAARSPAEVEAYRRAHDMNVIGSNIPKPISSFEEASFPCKSSFFSFILFFNAYKQSSTRTSYFIINLTKNTFFSSSCSLLCLSFLFFF